MSAKRTTGRLLKLLPESYRSIRQLIRALEVYVGHFLYDIFYEHAYDYIDAILPHKYWIPALFLSMCLFVQHRNFVKDAPEYTAEKFIMSCDPDTITLNDYRTWYSTFHVPPPAVPPPVIPVPPAWYHIVGRLAMLFWALFSGIIIQHIFIVLGLVLVEDDAYDSAADKFVQLEGNGVGSEAIMAFCVAQVISDQYEECLKEVLKEPSRAAQLANSRFFIKPLFFAFAFYVIRRFFRNLSGSVLPSFDSIPLLIALLVVSYPYILADSSLKSAIDTVMASIRAVFIHILGILYDELYYILAGILCLLYGFSLVVSPPSSWQQQPTSTLKFPQNRILRSFYIFSCLLYYYAHWIAFHLRFDWWFAAGLGISVMGDKAFPSFLYATALPVFQAFRSLSWWFPFFDTGREMALTIQQPTW
jgi:hypothetical protein